MHHMCFLLESGGKGVHDGVPEHSASVHQNPLMSGRRLPVAHPRLQHRYLFWGFQSL